MARSPAENRRRVEEHRTRLRKQGLRPIQLWVPDMRLDTFMEEARRQAKAARQSGFAEGDQAFVDSMSAFSDE
ncbi:antitoxin MazE family protein [Shinella sp. BYT-45]|uniref:antitoxin MazE family protein n=1 Tax=Shinella sp. BYT-45 TaxID=3377377 RepID=UPI00397F97CE